MIKKNGFTSLEILIGMIVFLIAFIGVATIFINKKAIDTRNKELALSTQIAKRIISEIKSQTLTGQEHFNNYRNLASGTLLKNLSSSFFTQGFYTGTPVNVATSTIKIDSITDILSNTEKSKYVAEINVVSGDASITQNLTPALDCPSGAVNIKNIIIDKLPSAIGINSSGDTLITLIGSQNNPNIPATIPSDKTDRRDNVYVNTPNDGSKNFRLSINCSPNPKGRKNIQNNYYIGDVLIAKSKELTVSIFYANRNNIDSKANITPIVTLKTKLAIPM